MDLNYRYTDFEDDVGHLTCAIKLSTFKPDLIVGLARGGLPLAVSLSHQLDIEMESINWPREESVRSSAWHIGDYVQEGKKILIVDDIVDTGRTFTSLFEHLQAGQVEDLKMENIRIAALMKYTDVELDVNFVALNVDRNIYDWVRMPWEVKNGPKV